MATTHRRDILDDAVRGALQAAVTQSVDEIVVEAQAQIQERLRGEVGRIVLTLLSEYNVERQGDVMVIKVQLPK